MYSQKVSPTLGQDHTMATLQHKVKILIFTAWWYRGSLPAVWILLCPVSSLLPELHSLHHVGPDGLPSLRPWAYMPLSSSPSGHVALQLHMGISPLPNDLPVFCCNLHTAGLAGCTLSRQWKHLVPCHRCIERFCISTKYIFLFSIIVLFRVIAQPHYNSLHL